VSIGIRTNNLAIRAANQQSNVHSQLGRTLDQASSGHRITRAADDAAGSAISIELSAQIHSNEQAIRNANDGISMSHMSQASVHTARDLLDQRRRAARDVRDLLDRARELAVQSSSDIMSQEQRTYIDDEWRSILSEMKRLAQVTDFNGQKVSNGEEYDVQVGTGNTDNDRITLSMGSVRAVVIAVGVIDLSSDSATSQTAIDRIDIGIKTANSQLATLGAQENRLMSSIQFAQSHGEALAQSKSRITDADMAATTTQMTALQIKNQASASALSQASQISSGVIGLISG